MKAIFILILLLNNLIITATTFYVSSNGSDLSDGQSPHSSWKTIKKLNSEFSGFTPGDKVLFRRGDTFYGTILLSASGIAGKPIILGAYGAGEKPIISGFATVSDWTDKGGGIFAKAIDCESIPNMVTVNGINTPIGRWPNSGYMTIDSHITNSSIYDSSLPSIPNWTGAEVVIRKNAYIWDRNVISKHSDNTLNYISGSFYHASDGNGYFIQNDIKTLDKLYEWSYVGSIFNMYFGSSDPDKCSVKVSSLDQLAYLDDIKYITIENIAFEGANVYGINIRNSGNIIVRNCKFDFTGGIAIFGPWWGTSPDCIIEDNTINQSNSNGIKLFGDHTDATIINNYVTNTGLIIGMGWSGDGTCNAIETHGDNNLLQHNVIINSGYMGINFGGNNTAVKNNYIKSFNMIKNDGGGIYTYIGTGTPSSGQLVSDNIILVGKGYADGLSTPAEHAFGIYIDDRARDVEIKDNSVAECSGAGIYLHNAHEIEILNNTLYNNGGNNQVYGSQVLLVHDGYSPDDPIRNVVMHNNILFAKNKTQKILSFSTKDNDVELFGKSDYNYYYSPSENKIFRIWTEGWNGAAENLTFREWQIKTGQDSNTVLPPPALAEIFEWKMNNTLTRKGVITVGETEIYPDLADIRFEYNPAMTTKVVPINDLYIDVKGNRYSKSVLIPPYKSLILIRLN